MDLSSDDARSIAADTAANPLLHEASLHPESLAQQRRGDIPPQAPVILFWPAGGSVLVALHVGGIVDAGGSSELSSLSTTRTRYVAAVRPATETGYARNASTISSLEIASITSMSSAEIALDKAVGSVCLASSLMGSYQNARSAAPGFDSATKNPVDAAHSRLMPTTTTWRDGRRTRVFYARGGLCTGNGATDPATSGNLLSRL